jgi:hypothetical protein
MAQTPSLIHLSPWCPAWTWHKVSTQEQWALLNGRETLGGPRSHRLTFLTSCPLVPECPGSLCCLLHGPGSYVLTSYAPSPLAVQPSLSSRSSWTLKKDSWAGVKVPTGPAGRVEGHEQALSVEGPSGGHEA